MAAPRPQKPLDVLPQTVNQVLIQVGKVLKSAGKDGKCNASIGNVVASTKIPASIEVFNAALDEIEADILRAKSVLQRDLNHLRATRRQEQRVAPTAPMAPMAPMAIDLSSPKMIKSTVPTPVPVPSPASGPAYQTFAGSNPNSSRPVKQESKPVAPFPNMGFDLTASPEVTPVPIPSPKTIPKAREPKNSPRTTAAAKPATVRKETKILPPQPPRSASGSSQSSPMMKKATPAARQGIHPVKQTPVPVPTLPTKQTPVPIPSIPPTKQTPVPIPVPPSVVAPQISALQPVAAPAPHPAPGPVPTKIPTPAQVRGPALTPTKVPVPVPVPTPVQVSAPPQGSAPSPVPVLPQVVAPPASMPPTTGAENIFTDMTFSLAPPETPGGANQTQPLEIDLVALGAGGGDLSSFNVGDFQAGGGGPAAMANMDFGGQQGGNEDSKMSGADDKIDTLFDLGSAGIDNIEMNYDLGDNGGDNSSFNDMFFNMNDDNMTNNQYDHTYFGLQ